MRSRRLLVEQRFIGPGQEPKNEVPSKTLIALRFCCEHDGGCEHDGQAMQVEYRVRSQEEGFVLGSSSGRDGTSCPSCRPTAPLHCSAVWELHPAATQLMLDGPKQSPGPLRPALLARPMRMLGYGPVSHWAD